MQREKKDEKRNAGSVLTTCSNISLIQDNKCFHSNSVKIIYIYIIVYITTFIIPG